MNTYLRICLSLFALLTLHINIAASTTKPTGLLTDLLRYPDKVLINGYVSSVQLTDMSSAIEPIEYAKIKSDSPSFSWIVPGEKNGTMQKSYRIIVASNRYNAERGIGNVWDSGNVDSHQSTGVVYNGTPLKPSQNYFWRVKCTTTTDGESEWSDIMTFRTAEELKPYGESLEVLRKEVQYPITIDTDNKDIQTIDFGKAAFGQLTLTLTSDIENDSITINLGEAFKDGRVDPNAGLEIRYHTYRLALQKGTHTYKIKVHKDKRNTSKGAILMPDYIGEVVPFRYVEILDYKNKLNQTSAFREAVHYPFSDNASYFRSDNEILNQVWDLCKYTMKAASFSGYYVDGDRERIPYEADVLINMLGHYNVDREFSMARNSQEYLLNNPTWPTEWILQAVLIAWYDYMHTGDSRYIAANYDLLKNRALMQLKEKNGLISTTTGLQNEAFLKSINFNRNLMDIVDWPNAKSGNADDHLEGEDDGFIFTDYNAVTNAFHYEALVLLERMANELGKDEDAKFYKKESDKLKDIYVKSFLDTQKGIMKDGISTDHTSLHANMFAFDFNLVPDKYIPNVLDFIRSRKMACSVYGSQFLLESLYKGFDGDYALSLLTSQDVRSWYNMIREGSTMTFEAWDIRYKDNQDWNHAWGASPANIIPRKLVGVEPILPGYEKARINPQIGSLKNVESLIPTIRGDIKVKINNTDNYILEVTIPANMKADIYLPAVGNKVTCNGEPIKVKKDKDAPTLFAGEILSGTYTFVVTK